ncbi:uncharacterized protein FOMMEDRAFT_150492 [Fomitiporia mediterranea MF3/22]|uniref:uncharacterized protein n=1 Tax=Fomitiporia mediterranea (strain MF3/22) TaxID=694068 RepID=UPI00044072D0|nr:uncharacterized protein FOMMEDRAFT_150492 [Fomitiporia mediterranea MF3/22]EJD07898.1 hypothetical protein FOMMEDRAFT_150492 [Fomitiporia mediterranea MF3/22]
MNTKEYTTAELNAALNQFDFENRPYTEGDIRKKYLEKAKKFHSDKNGADEEMKKAYEEAFKKVCRYKDILEWKLQGIEPKRPEEPIKPSTQSRRDYSPCPDSSDDDFRYSRSKYRRRRSSDSDDNLGHGYSKEYINAYNEYMMWKKKVKQNEERTRQQEAKETRYCNSRREEKSSGHSSHRRDSDRQHNYRPQYAPEPKQYTRGHDSDEEREFLKTTTKAREDAEAQRKKERCYTRSRPDVNLDYVRAPSSSTAHRRSSGHDDRFFKHVPAPGAPKTARPVPTRDDRREREHRQVSSSTKTTTRTTSGMYVNGHPVENISRSRMYVNGYPVDRIVCNDPDEYVNEDHYCDSPDEYADERYHDRVNGGSKYSRPPKSSYYSKGPRYHR